MKRDHSTNFGGRIHPYHARRVEKKGGSQMMRIQMLMSSVAVLFVLLGGTVGAAEGDVEWEKTFGGGDFDFGYSVQQTTDGGYIVGGYTDYGSGDKYFYLVKTNSGGDLMWQKTFGGSSADGGYSVQQTLDGGYIIAGYTYYSDSYYDVYLIKTNSDGDPIWQKILVRQHYYDTAHSVQQTSDGGYVITGHTASYAGGYADVYLIKTNSDGDLMWEKTFGGSNEDRGYSVQQTSDGGYIIAGYTNSYGAGGRNVYFIKTNSDGDLMWEKTFGGSGFNQGNSVQQTSDGGYIIAGNRDLNGSGDYDVYLVKTNSDGDLQWEKTFGGSDYDCGNSVQQTSDSGYIIAGYTNVFGSGYDDVYLVKTNSDGDLMWEKTFGGSSADGGYSVQQTLDGGYIIAGYTWSNDSYYDVYLIKVSGGVSSPTLCDMNRDGIVSIVGDVPPFVQVIYFQDYTWYEEHFPGGDPVGVGDCNGDGILSIVGDVPCFVDCAYFGYCPD
jgi:uncharacterized delta-60 repeat protein